MTNQPATGIHENGEGSSVKPNETPSSRPAKLKKKRPSETSEGEEHQQPVFLSVHDQQIAAQLERYLPEAKPIRPPETPDHLSVDGNVNNYLFVLKDHDISPAGTETGGDSPTVLEEARRQPQEAKQNSLVTIFSIWNTIMGTSILAMPWVIQQAGFATSIFLILFVAALACYTGYLTLSATLEAKKLRGMKADEPMDFTDACQYHLGKAGRIVAIVFSQIALIGALIVYYVLLTNFLYNTGDYIYRKVTNDNSSEATVITIWNKTYSDVICNNLPLVPLDPASPIHLHETPDDAQPTVPSESRSLYQNIWSPTRTVPAWLLVLLFPLISIRSPTFLGKFTALGTVSVAYLFILVCIKTGYWGFHLDFSSLHPYKIIYQFRPTFASLTGVCSLAFFIHNALHTIMRNQRRPENNGRDIVIAFGFTTATYTIIGILFFSSFPLAKSCIEDNFLNNLSTDIPVFIGRLSLLFQMLTVYPMLVYVLRVQIMLYLFKNAYPSFRHVFVLHVFILGTGLTFAMVLPKIGTIIRFSGALCGLVYIFTLPPLISLLNKRVLYKKLTSANGLSSHKPPPLGTPSGTVVAGGAQTESEGASPLLSKPTSSSNLNQSFWWRHFGATRLQVYWYLRVFCCSFIIFLGVANFVAQFVVFFAGVK